MYNPTDFHGVVYTVREMSRIKYTTRETLDGKCFLSACCQDDKFEDALKELCAREEQLLKDLGCARASQTCQLSKACHHQRECLQISFLPEVVGYGNSSGTEVVLGFKCFDTGKLVVVSQLIESYYLSALTAYRVAMSLVVLVNRLIALNVEVELSIDNLLIDLDSSYCTLIDWSVIRFCDCLNPLQRVTYYHCLARIMLRLVDGVPAEVELVDGTRRKCHIARAEPNDVAMRRLLSWVDEVLAIEYHLPARLGEATDYVTRIQAQLEELPQQLWGAAHSISTSELAPPYELKRRVKLGGEQV